MARLEPGCLNRPLNQLSKRGPILIKRQAMNIQKLAKTKNRFLSLNAVG